MSTGTRWRGRDAPLIGAAVAAAALLATSAGVLAASASTGSHPATAGPAAPTTAAQAPAVAATGARQPATGATGRSAPTTTTGAVTVDAKARPVTLPAKPRRHGPRTRVVHYDANVHDATAGLAIRLDGVVAPDTPRPVFSPRVGGTWKNLGPYEVFAPTSTLHPCSSYKLTIPARTFALRHRVLGTAQTVTLSVACPGVTAMQEALARLGYLPYTLHGFVGASSAAALTRHEAARRAYELPHGKLLPNVPGAPPLQIGTLDATTTGAIEVFEGDHNLPLTTTPSEQLWIALLSDETLAARDDKPYTWVTVTETVPETLKVHEGAKVALSSPTNTGVPGASTQTGIFPIYERFVATTMIGTNVDGSHYDDPGVPWVNYFNGGDAVHGYIRPGYGYPQSNGCVELPISTAQTVFGMLQLGDLVIVE